MGKTSPVKEILGCPSTLELQPSKGAESYRGFDSLLSHHPLFISLYRRLTPQKGQNGKENGKVSFNLIGVSRCLFMVIKGGMKGWPVSTVLGMTGVSQAEKGGLPLKNFTPASLVSYAPPLPP